MKKSTSPTLQWLGAATIIGICGLVTAISLSLVDYARSGGEYLCNGVNLMMPVMSGLFFPVEAQAVQLQLAWYSATDAVLIASDDGDLHLIKTNDRNSVDIQTFPAISRPADYVAAEGQPLLLASYYPSTYDPTGLLDKRPRTTWFSLLDTAQRGNVPNLYRAAVAHDGQTIAGVQPEGGRVMLVAIPDGTATILNHIVAGDNRVFGWSTDDQFLAVGRRTRYTASIVYSDLQAGRSYRSLFSDWGTCVQQAHWSPQQNTVAFAGTRRGLDWSTTGYDIYVEEVSITRRERSLHNLTNTEDADEFDVVWSPDGNTLVFVRTLVEDDRYEQELFAVTLANGTIQQLTRTPGIHEFAPVWSTDGQHIYYLAWLSDGHVVQLQRHSLASGETVTVMELPSSWYLVPSVR